MMKFRLVLIGIVLFASNVFAQKQVYVGVTGGANVSTVFFNHLAFPTNIRTVLQTNTHFGVNFKHFAPVKRGFLNTGIQFSFNYVEKGWSQEFTDRPAIPNYTVSLKYLEVPFSGIVYFGKKKTKVFLSAGIFTEFLISDSTSDIPADEDETTDIIDVGLSDVFPFDSDRDNTIGAGGKAELGILRDFGFGAIQLSTHFTYSITNVLNFGTRSSGIPDTSNNLVIGASIGYFFKFKKKDETEE